MPTEKLTGGGKNENPKRGLKNFLSEHSKLIIVLVLLALIAIPIIEMMYILSLKGLFSYFANKVVNTGANPYLAKAIVLFLMIPLLWSFKWTFSFRSQRRKAGYAIVAGYILLFYVSMFFMTKEQKFDFSTGKAIKFYAQTPEGIRYFDAPGFDPKYGIKLTPVDPKMSKSEALRTRPPKKLEAPDKFFDFVTKEPLVWYYEGPNDTLEFSDQPGFHPKYGDELKPITPQVVQKYEMLEKARKPKAEAEQKRIEDEEKKRREALGETTGKYEAPQTAPANSYPLKQPLTKITPEQVIQGLRGTGQSRTSQMDEMKSFISNYLRANENKEMEKVLSFYGDTVDYYSNGLVLKSFIKKDKETFVDFCHKLSYTLADDLRITNLGNSGRCTVTFTTSYFIESSKKNVSGTAINTWDIDNANTNPKIIAEKQTVLDRKETRHVKY